MSSGICDTSRTRLSFADTRLACRLDPSGQGRGNVETTPLGFVRDGAIVEGHMPTSVGRDRCSPVYRKPACPPC